jgi:cobyrinic acid a,c-diamide synthase
VTPAAPIVAVARDEAFSFYYPANLERLSDAGARLVPFSPLRDAALPDGTGLVYLGGGYPELFAPALAENRRMRDAVRAFAAAGGSIYAECGGLMYLADTLVAADGTAHAMAGVLVGAVTTMTGGLPDFGYVEVETRAPTPLGARGLRLRGHRFHASTLAAAPAAARRAYRLARPAGDAWGEEGFLVHGTLASYVHLLFDGVPEVAASLVAAARRSQ